MHHPDFYQLTEEYFKAYLLARVNLIEILRRNYLVMAILHCSKIYGKYFCLLEITLLLFKPLFVYSYATGTSWVSQHENVCDTCNSDNLEYQFKC